MLKKIIGFALMSVLTAGLTGCWKSDTEKAPESAVQAEAAPEVVPAETADAAPTEAAPAEADATTEETGDQTEDVTE